MRISAPPQHRPRGSMVSGGTQPNVATSWPHAFDVPLRVPRTISSRGHGHDFGKVHVHPPLAQGVRTALGTAIERMQVGGAELRGETRPALERAFGVDLGAVRIHVDTAAGRLTRSLGAQAFTSGHHIFFGPAEPGGAEPCSACGGRKQESCHRLHTASRGRTSKPARHLSRFLHSDASTQWRRPGRVACHVD
jgi:hypothetical protein